MMGQPDTRKPSADVVALDQERLKRHEASDAELSTAGGMLRAAREALSLRPETVAKRTNIRLQHLLAIEAMELDRLPAQPYTMGFVRAYAREVSLPEEALMERFRDQAGYRRSAEAPEIKPAAGGRGGMDEGRELSVLALVSIIAFVLWCAWSLLLRTDPSASAEISRFEQQAPTASSSTTTVAAVPLTTETTVDLSREAPAANDQAEAQAGEVINNADVATDDSAPASGEETGPSDASTSTESASSETVEEPVAQSVALRRIEGIEPVYPPLCESEAAAVETVRVRYGVNGSGMPVAPRVIRSTNPCFNGAAVAALVRWRYDRSTVTAENSRGLTHTFTFEQPF